MSQAATRCYVLHPSNPFASQVLKLKHFCICTRIHVSFCYPGKDDFAPRDVSFEIQKGQLCGGLMHPPPAISGACLTLER